MEDSDSEYESECFESAEESLDEEETEAKEKNSRKSRNGCEVAEPVVSVRDASVIHAERKDVSSNSLTYRKRPERLRRLSSKSPPQVETPTKVSVASESIFKTDKIAPDVFFQDITSNLSKNINKSLNTLHQTSSNVKDLILSSLPVVSVDEREGFSYDGERSVFSVDDGNETGNEVFGNDKLVDIVPFDNNKRLKSFGDIIKNVSVSCEENISIESKKNKEEKVEGKNTEDTEIREENEIIENSVEECDRIRNDKRNNEEKVKEKDSAERVIAEGKEEKSSGKKIEECDNVGGNDTEKNDEVNIKEPADTNIMEIEKSSKDKIIENSIEGKDIEKDCGVPDCTVKDRKPSGTDSNNVFIEKEFEEVVEVSKEKLSEKIIENEKFKELESLGVSHTQGSGDAGEDSNQLTQKSDARLIETEEIFKGKEGGRGDYQVNPSRSGTPKVLSDNWGDFPGGEAAETKTSEGGWDDFDEVPEESAIAPPECNLEELKSVLKQMVPEEMVENECPGESQPGETSKDGWDDFDFSDSEIENPVVDKVEDVKGKCERSKKTNEQKELKEIRKPSGVGSLKIAGGNGFEKTKSNKEKTAEEGKGEKKSEDWDWDGWDEAAPTRGERVPAKNEKDNTAEEDFFSDNRWGGWDTFGQKPEEKQGNWNIGSWGVNMLLNKATAVTQGISNVLGAPDPETLARMEKLEREKSKLEGRSETETEEPPPEICKKNSVTDVNLFPVFGITSLVAGVTSKIVEHSKIQEIGSKVITGGLDTLETFGKKTMEVLQEGDPGLKNKRALLLGPNKPVLSQVLREAREKADTELRKVEEKELAKKCHFETLFDDFQGMVHLEALEMLSRQCELKLEQIRSAMNAEEQEDLDGILEEVEQLCSLDDYDSDSSSVIDFKISLNMAVDPLKDEISVKQIIQIHDDVVKWLQGSSDAKPSVTVIHQKVVSTLAELAAATVHQFHKAGELLSVKECRKTVEEVDALSRMTSVVCMEIKNLCDKFVVLSKSNKEASPENASSVLEKVDTVMKNSTSYIKQAFNLLIPVVQIGAAV